MKSYEEVKNLTDEEAQIYVKQIISNTSDKGQLEDKLLEIALFTNGNSLQNVYPTLIEKEIFYPPEIYIHADERIAILLINLINTEISRLYLNRILSALAWIGTPNVLTFFEKSTREKPEWTKQLYVLPNKYAEVAGWTFDELGNKRLLIHKKNISVLTNDFSKADPSKHIETFKKHSENCPFCKGPLTTFFKIKIDDESIETNFTACSTCSCFYPVFMKIDTQGESKWCEKNEKWEHLSDDMGIDDFPENILSISTEKRKSEFTINPFIEITKSQIGGYPSWIQDSEYLECPDCSKKMDYIGQIDREDIEEYGEGIYYFHYCKKCKITGTNYQQT